MKKRTKSEARRLAAATALRSISLPVLSVLVALVVFPPLPLPHAPPVPQDSHQEPLSRPIDYFRHADNLTNLRLPGAEPFSMRVTFQAYPGVDFTRSGHSPILTGQGVYQETWISPTEWRREVTLGSYHAVEIRAAGKRTFQASSSYEPTRVMMLLSALLAPIPRSILEPELEEHPPHWKLEHRMAGSIPWVRISVTESANGVSFETAYDFLPSGILVRSEDYRYNGILTSWDDDQDFAGKIVPRHATVEGPGLSGPMVSAIVTLSPVSPSGRAIAQVSAQPADPGSTLQPIDPEGIDNSGASTIRFEVPPLPPDHFPSGAEIVAIAVIDRDGMPRDVEISAIRDQGQPLSQPAKDIVWRTARQMVASLLKNRYHPALVDGKPCQVYWSLTMATRDG